MWHIQYITPRGIKMSTENHTVGTDYYFSGIVSSPASIRSLSLAVYESWWFQNLTVLKKYLFLFVWIFFSIMGNTICTKVTSFTSFPRVTDATYGCGCSSLSLDPTEDQAWPKDQHKYWWPPVLALSLLAHAHMVLVWKSYMTSFLSYYVQDF